MRWVGLVFSFSVFASSSEGSFLGEVGFQAFNFFLFLFLLLFFIKKPIQFFFKNRRELFLKEEKEARKKEEELTKERATWVKKMKEAIFDEKNFSNKVKQEVLRYKEQKQAELLELKERFKREREFIFQLEEQKTRKQILREVRNQVTSQAKKELISKGENKEFQSHLYKSFSKQLRRKDGF